jgi:hypothetical protein
MTMPVPPLSPLFVEAVTQLKTAPTVLWEEVVRARAALADERQLTQGSAAAAARTELLRALEAYVESLSARGRPIPYAMRDELRLQRLTCPPDRRSTPAARALGTRREH